MIYLLRESLPYLCYGILIHRICDWLLQNEWMALNKLSLKNIAAWVHSGIHFVCLLPLFGLPLALLIGLFHVIIDTRRVLNWWGSVIGQTMTGEVATHVKFNRDQVLHEIVIAFTALAKVYWRI